jgi:hypothetical protein
MVGVLGEVGSQKSHDAIFARANLFRAPVTKRRARPRRGRVNPYHSNHLPEFANHRTIEVLKGLTNQNRFLNNIQICR